jgi:hypothetical protein
MSKSPKFDPQRQELYRMEKHGLFGLNRARVTRKEHRIILNLACKQFGVPAPVLKYETAKAWAGTYNHVPAPTIALSTVYASGLSPMTLLHEAAHHIVWCADPADHLAPHGPEFVGVYGDLLECMGYIPFGSWQLLTTQFKIKCLDTGSLRPQQLLAAIKKRAAEAAPKSPTK